MRSPNQQITGFRAGIGAINAADLPLQVPRRGAFLAITRLTFSYEGQATNLQLGVGIKRHRTLLRWGQIPSSTQYSPGNSPTKARLPALG